jgi:peroxiredoxin
LYTRFMARPRKPLAIGDKVPDLRLPRLEGGDQPLVSNAPVLLAFFKISCPVCQFTLPYVERLRPNLHVVGISQNDAADTREFNEAFHLTLPTLLDREDDDFPASNAFGITHVPTLFLIEPDGRIARVIDGWNKKEMEQLGAIRDTDNVPVWKAG